MLIKTHHDRSGSLCATCREGQVVEHDNGDILTLCHAWGMQPFVVTRPVVRCSDYDQRGHQKDHELEKIAWTIRTDKSGKAIGFERPKVKEE